MNAKLKQAIFLVIAFALAIFFVVITAKQVNYESIKNALQEANYFWIISAMVISVFTYWIRAARWNLLLHPMGYNTKVQSGFWAIAFGYFLNLTIPRSGEVARATSLYKMEDVPFQKSFGTIVLERIIDLICLLLVFGLTLIFNYKTFIHFLNISNQEQDGVTIEKTYTKYYIFIGIVIFLFILGFIFRKKIVKTKIYHKIIHFFKGLWEGIISISKLQKRGLFIFYSVLLWVCYFFMTYLVFFAFPATSHFTFAEGLFILIAGSFGLILPVTGGLAYPYVVSIAFSAIYLATGGSQNEGREIGNYFGLILYLSQVISMIAFGLLAIVMISRISSKKVTN